MRNLLTAFDANRNHEMRRKIFSRRIANFFNSWHAKFSSLAGLQKLVCVRISSYVRYRAPSRQNFSAEIGFVFRNGEKFPLPRSCEARPAESPQFCCFLSLPTAAKLFASKSI